jgi:hypothetical protein
VRETVRSDPYRDLLARFRDRFSVENDTDTNDDVSFNYLLRRGDQTWRVALSMVGPYALLVRAMKDGRTQVVVKSSEAAEAEILSAVQSLGFAFLDRDTIRQRIDPGYTGDRQDDWTVYEALFSNAERPPG